MRTTSGDAARPHRRHTSTDARRRAGDSPGHPAAGRLLVTRRHRRRGRPPVNLRTTQPRARLRAPPPTGTKVGSRENSSTEYRAGRSCPMCRIGAKCAAGSGPTCPRCRPPSVSPPALTAAKTGLTLLNLGIARTDTKGEGKTDHRQPTARGASMSTERPHSPPNPISPAPQPSAQSLPIATPTPQPAHRRPVSPSVSQGIRNAGARIRPTPGDSESQLSDTHCMGCRQPLKGGQHEKKDRVGVRGFEPRTSAV